MCMKTPSTPPPPATPDPPKQAPKQADLAVQQAYADEKAGARRAAGRSGSILTGFSLQDTAASTAKRTILG